MRTTQPTCTLHLGRAHSAIWAPCYGRVVVRRAPYRGRVAGVPCRVVVRKRSLVCRVVVLLPSPPVMIQNLYRESIHATRALCAVSCPAISQVVWQHVAIVSQHVAVVSQHAAVVLQHAVVVSQRTIAVS